MPSFPTKRVLGIEFFDGSVDQAVECISQNGGLVVAPAAPSMIALQHDEEYRRAIAEADLAIADSGWMVLFWRIFSGERLTRISGLRFLKHLLDLPEVRSAGKILWILPTETAKTKTLAWLGARNFKTTAEDFYVAPRYGEIVQDAALLEIIKMRQPPNIVVGVGGGTQDKLGLYMKRHCGYRPAIYCIGGALAFLTGDQVQIPMWADRMYLGWIFRTVSQPNVYLLRYWRARILARMIKKYGRDLPPLIAP